MSKTVWCHVRCLAFLLLRNFIQNALNAVIHGLREQVLLRGAQRDGAIRRWRRISRDRVVFARVGALAAEKASQETEAHAQLASLTRAQDRAEGAVLRRDDIQQAEMKAGCALVPRG
ncbi:hypothetical protein BH20VER3_BH20VER3_20870 [soil metagenome]